MADAQNGETTLAYIGFDSGEGDFGSNINCYELFMPIVGATFNATDRDYNDKYYSDMASAPDTPNVPVGTLVAARVFPTRDKHRLYNMQWVALKTPYQDESF